MHLWNLSKHGRKGFTLIELLIVLFIMTLLAALAAPSFSRLVRSTKVEQAARILMSAMWQARTESQRNRRTIALYFGDDEAMLDPAPLPGVLPRQGCIELWTVKTDGNGAGATDLPLGCRGSWYPYKDPDTNLTRNAITLPAGIRVLAGNFAHEWDGRVWQNKFWFSSFSRTPIGEIKRHYVAYSKSGGMPGYYDGLYSYFSVLVFDDCTGDHLLIWCGEWRAAAKPRLLPYKLTAVTNLSGQSLAVTDFRHIPSHIDR